MTNRSAPQSDRSFWFLLQGQIVSQLGTQLFQVIVVLALKQASESATLIGLLLMCYTIPAALLGPIGGVLVDRYSQRTMLIAGDLFRGITLLGLTFVLWMSPRVEVVITILFAYAVLEGSVGAVWLPASMSLVPELVPAERLAGANSLLQGSLQLCTIFAQALASLLFKVLGTPVLMAMDGLSYLYAAASDTFIRVQPRRAMSVRPSFKLSTLKLEILEGLQHLRAKPGMRAVFYTMATFQLLVVPILILFPFFVEQMLHAGSEWYGFLLAASGAGTLLGYIAGGALPLGGLANSRLIVGATFGMAVCFSSLGFVTSRWMALGIVFAAGMMSGFNSLKLITLLQLATVAHARGRVFSLFMTISQGLTPLAMGLTGVIADLTHRNIPLIYFVCGCAAAGLAANLGLRASCREFMAGEPAEVPVEMAMAAPDRGVRPRGEDEWPAAS